MFSLMDHPVFERVYQSLPLRLLVYFGKLSTKHA